MVQKTRKDRLNRFRVPRWLSPRVPLANRTTVVGLLVIAIIIAITLVALVEIHPPWLAIDQAGG